MGTTAQKLQNILSSKSALKTAIAKFKSNVGDKLSDYAPVVSNMADYANGLVDISTDGNVIDTIVIPFKSETTLRPYLFYNVNAENTYIENGFTTISARQFTYMNRNITSHATYVYLPNSITTVSTANVWATAGYIVPVLESGWKASISLSGLTHRYMTQTVLENMIDALTDLTGETGQTLTLANSTQYNSISAAKKAEATAKNWTVTY